MQPNIEGGWGGVGRLGGTTLTGVSITTREQSPSHRSLGGVITNSGLEDDIGHSLRSHLKKSVGKFVDVFHDSVQKRSSR